MSYACFESINLVYYTGAANEARFWGAGSPGKRSIKAGHPVLKIHQKVPSTSSGHPVLKDHRSWTPVKHASGSPVDTARKQHGNHVSHKSAKRTPRNWSPSHPWILRQVYKNRMLF